MTAGPDGGEDLNFLRTCLVWQPRRLHSSSAQLRPGRWSSITVAGSADQGAVITQAKELVRFERKRGYQLDELVRIIKDAG